MKKLLFILASILMCSNIDGASMPEIWRNMPDSIVHRVGGLSLCDSLTSDYVKATISDAETIEIKRLPVTDSDSILCMVRTFDGVESDILFFTQQWKSLPCLIADKEAFQHIEDSSDGHLVMTMASLSTDSNDIAISLSFPLAAVDENGKCNNYRELTTLKWDGTVYK